MITVPQNYQEGVFKIAKLEEKTVRAVREALDAVSVSPGLSPQSMISAVSALAQEQEEGLKPVADTLLTLYRVRAINDIPLDEFIDGITEAMKDVESNQRITGDESDKLRRNLIALLGADSLSLVSKVKYLQASDERNFCSARIVTDMRPVFGSPISQGPRAWVVVHTLDLGYHRYGKHDEIQVGLDEDDLHTLKDVVDRAIEKAKALAESQKGLPLFGVRKE